MFDKLVTCHSDPYIAADEGTFYKNNLDALLI